MILSLFQAFSFVKRNLCPGKSKIWNLEILHFSGGLKSSVNLPAVTAAFKNCHARPAV